jgi:hypothetical protein
MATHILKVNKGDSFKFRLPVQDFMLTRYDVIYFAIMNPNQGLENALLIQGYTKEDIEVDINGKFIPIKLTSRDTAKFDPGVYYYVVKLQVGGSLDDLGKRIEPDEVRTIIERTKFIINE